MSTLFIFKFMHSDEHARFIAEKFSSMCKHINIVYPEKLVEPFAADEKNEDAIIISDAVIGPFCDIDDYFKQHNSSVLPIGNKNDKKAFLYKIQDASDSLKKQFINGYTTEKKLYKALKRIAPKNNAFNNAYDLFMQKHPFIGLETFKQFTNKQFLWKKIKERNLSVLPNECLLKDVLNPNEQLWVFNKLVIADDKIIEIPENYKIGVHIHAYFPDKIESILKYFVGYKENCKFIITSDTEAKKNYIESILNDYNFTFEVVITENHGRDILPWIKIKDKLADCDIACHLHCKQSNQIKKTWIVENWEGDVFENLLNNIGHITNRFIENESLGVIIPDLPNHFAYESKYRAFNNVDKKYVGKLWSFLTGSDFLGISKVATPVMSYGTMLWYKPDVLSGLLTSKLERIFENEPLDNLHSFVHAFERLPVYWAWKNNYDFEIVVSGSQAQSKFLQYERLMVSEIYQKSMFKLLNRKMRSAFTRLSRLFIK